MVSKSTYVFWGPYHYILLTGKRQIRKAYYEKALEWHPDRWAVGWIA
jgi:hypothetical protein